MVRINKGIIITVTRKHLKVSTTAQRRSDMRARISVFLLLLLLYKKGKAPHPQANASTTSQLHKGKAPHPQANASTTSQLHKGKAPHPQANALTTSQLQGPFLQVNRINHLPVLQSYLQTCLQSHQTFLQIQIHRQLRDHRPLCPHHHHQSDCRIQNLRTDRSHRRIH